MMMMMMILDLAWAWDLCYYYYRIIITALLFTQIRVHVRVLRFTVYLKLYSTLQSSSASVHPIVDFGTHRNPQTP